MTGAEEPLPTEGQSEHRAARESGELERRPIPAVELHVSLECEASDREMTFSDIWGKSGGVNYIIRNFHDVWHFLAANEI